MANYHGKLLYSKKVDGMKSSGNDVNVGVYGIFRSNSGSGTWSYYLISYFTNKTGGINLTDEWHSFTNAATYESISKYSKEVKNIEEGKKICDEYALKWTTGSNDTIQEIRNVKLNEILK